MRWFAYPRPSLEERGWVPSPGDWIAPEGKRAGRDWIPPGGAGERLDRMPRWVRVWSHTPLRAIGRFDEWLWDHGGYDVEGPEAIAQRERRDALYQAQHAVIRGSLDGPGPWPARTTVRTQNVEVVDVDRYGGFAVVIAAIEDHVLAGVPMLEASVFHEEESGWRSHGGGGGGSGVDPLLVRQRWKDPTRVLRMSGPGWGRLDEKRGPKGVCHATLLCSATVSSVVIDRPGDRRTVDVSEGSGWIGIVWPQGSEPGVKAFDAETRELARLEPSAFEPDRENRLKPWRRLRHG
jgi:hypothetical protein